MSIVGHSNVLYSDVAARDQAKVANLNVLEDKIFFTDYVVNWFAVNRVRDVDILVEMMVNHAANAANAKVQSIIQDNVSPKSIVFGNLEEDAVIIALNRIIGDRVI